MDSKLTLCRRFEGILWAAFNGLTFAVVSGLTRYLKELSAHELTVYGAMACTVFASPVLVYYGKSIGKSISRKQIAFLILLCVARFSSLTLRGQAFKMIPLGDASAIAFNVPLVTAIFARVTLKERLSRLTILSLLLSLVGMSLTAKLPLILSSSEFAERVSTNEYLRGCGFAFASIIASSFAYIIGRGLRNLDPFINVFLSGILITLNGVTLSPLFGGFHLQSCTANSWVLVVFCFVNVLLVSSSTQAIRKEKAVVVSTIVRSTEIALAFIFQMTFFGESVDAYSSSGALIVVLSGLSLPLQNWMSELPDGSRWKITCLLK